MIQHYGPQKLRFILHYFPLPFHTASFYASWVPRMILALNSTGGNDGVKAWSDWLFNGGQENLWNAQIANMTLTQVQQYIAQTASSVSGVPYSSLMNLFQDSTTNEAARIGWKYGCTRGVSGTPTVLVNGLDVGADSTWTLQNWEAILDPLYTNNAKHDQAGKKHVLTLPSGTTIMTIGRS